MPNRFRTRVLLSAKGRAGREKNGEESREKFPRGLRPRAGMAAPPPKSQMAAPPPISKIPPATQAMRVRVISNLERYMTHYNDPTAKTFSFILHDKRLKYLQ